MHQHCSCPTLPLRQLCHEDGDNSLSVSSTGLRSDLVRIRWGKDSQPHFLSPHSPPSPLLPSLTSAILFACSTFHFSASLVSSCVPLTFCGRRTWDRKQIFLVVRFEPFCSCFVKMPLNGTTERTLGQFLV